VIVTLCVSSGEICIKDSPGMNAPVFFNTCEYLEWIFGIANDIKFTALSAGIEYFGVPG
jgi:hypothetical protein